MKYLIFIFQAILIYQATVRAKNLEDIEITPVDQLPNIFDDLPPLHRKNNKKSTPTTTEYYKIPLEETVVPISTPDEISIENKNPESDLNPNSDSTKLTSDSKDSSNSSELTGANTDAPAGNPERYNMTGVNFHKAMSPGEAFSRDEESEQPKPKKHKKKRYHMNLPLPMMMNDDVRSHSSLRTLEGPAMWPPPDPPRQHHHAVSLAKKTSNAASAVINAVQPEMKSQQQILQDQVRKDQLRKELEYIQRVKVDLLAEKLMQRAQQESPSKRANEKGEAEDDDDDDDDDDMSGKLTYGLNGEINNRISNNFRRSYSPRPNEEAGEVREFLIIF